MCRSSVCDVDDGVYDVFVLTVMLFCFIRVKMRIVCGWRWWGMYGDDLEVICVAYACGEVLWWLLCRSYCNEVWWGLCWIMMIIALTPYMFDRAICMMMKYNGDFEVCCLFERWWCCVCMTPVDDQYVYYGWRSWSSSTMMVMSVRFFAIRLWGLWPRRMGVIVSMYVVCELRFWIFRRADGYAMLLMVMRGVLWRCGLLSLFGCCGILFYWVAFCSLCAWTKRSGTIALTGCPC